MQERDRLSIEERAVQLLLALYNHDSARCHELLGPLGEDDAWMLEPCSLLRTKLAKPVEAAVIRRCWIMQERALIYSTDHPDGDWVWTGCGWEAPIARAVFHGACLAGYLDVVKRARNADCRSAWDVKPHLRAVFSADVPHLNVAAWFGENHVDASAALFAEFGGEARALRNDRKAGVKI